MPGVSKAHNAVARKLPYCMTVLNLWTCCHPGTFEAFVFTLFPAGVFAAERKYDSEVFICLMKYLHIEV